VRDRETTKSKDELWRVKSILSHHEVRTVGSIQPKRSIYLLLFSSVVREINKINERELELGVGSASWHDEYKGV